MNKEPISIVTDLKRHECYICGIGGDLALHHMLHGNKRRLADEDGLTCWLCPRCHTNLHDHGIKDRDLEQIAQQAWQRHNKQGIPAFIKRYGVNYL